MKFDPLSVIAWGCIFGGFVIAFGVIMGLVIAGLTHGIAG